MYLFLCVGIVIILIFTQGYTLAIYLQGTPTTWDQAYLECEAIGMQLAVLNSKADYDAAIAYISSSNTSVDNVWIGLKIKNVDTKLFEWINGEGLVYTNWLPGDPNYFQWDSCVRLTGIDLKFADRKCFTEYAFLCTEIKSEFPSSIYTADKVYASTTDVTTTYDVVHTTSTEVNSSTTKVYTKINSVPTTLDKDYTSNKEALNTTKVVHASTFDPDTITPGTYITDLGHTIPGIGYTGPNIIRNIIDTITRDNKLCMCSCSRVGNWKTHHYSFEELKRVLAPVTKQLRKELLIDKFTLSAYINKHISKNDSRKSSKQIGYVGMIIIILILVAILLIDIMTFCNT